MRLLRVKFVHQPRAEWKMADMPVCPRLGDYVETGFAGRWYVSAVRWEPFQQELDNPPPDLAFDVWVELTCGISPGQRNA